MSKAPDLKNVARCQDRLEKYYHSYSWREVESVTFLTDFCMHQDTLSSVAQA